MRPSPRYSVGWGFRACLELGRSAGRWKTGGKADRRQRLAFCRRQPKERGWNMTGLLYYGHFLRPPMRRVGWERAVRSSVGGEGVDNRAKERCRAVTDALGSERKHTSARLREEHSTVAVFLCVPWPLLVGTRSQTGQDGTVFWYLIFNSRLPQPIICPRQHGQH